MSQSTMHPSGDALAFAQETVAFGRSEDRELRKLRRKNSFFSMRNLWGMVKGVCGISAEYLMYLVMMIIFSPFLVFGGARLLESNGVVVPVAVTIALSAVLPLGMLCMFLHVNANKEMTAKRKAVASARRAVERIDRKARPVLTPDHVAVREDLGELFQGAYGMPKEDRVVNADDIFTLILSDFDNADVVMKIVEERKTYTAEEVRAVLFEMSRVAKPLQDGAL